MTQLTFDPPTTEPMTAGGRVDAVDVCRIVGTRQILQEVSLSIEPGELVAIAGGSGAGKTTLLEILAGLQPPSAGQVRHNGVVRGARVCDAELRRAMTLRYRMRGLYEGRSPHARWFLRPADF